MRRWRGNVFRVAHTTSDRSRPLLGRGRQKSPKLISGVPWNIEIQHRERMLSVAKDIKRQRAEQVDAFTPWSPIAKALRASLTEPRRTRATLRRVARRLDAERRQHPDELDTLAVKAGSKWASLGDLISDCDASWDPARGRALVRMTLRALERRFSHILSLTHTKRGRPDDYALKAATRMLAEAGVSNTEIAGHLGESPKQLWPNGTYKGKRKPGTTVEARRRRSRGKSASEEADMSVEVILEGLAECAKALRAEIGDDCPEAVTLGKALEDLAGHVNGRQKSGPVDASEERRVAKVVREAIDALRSIGKRARPTRTPRVPGSLR